MLLFKIMFAVFLLSTALYLFLIKMSDFYVLRTPKPIEVGMVVALYTMLISFSAGVITGTVVLL